MNTVQELKHSIARENAVAQSKAWKEYQKILRRIVEGKAVDPIELQTSLKLAGRSVEQLDADVENMRFRDSIRDRQRKAEAVQPEIERIQAELDTLKAEKQAFLDAIIPRIEAAVEKKTNLVGIASQASGCTMQLRETCLDPGLALEAELVDEKIRELRTKEAQMNLALPEYRDADWLARLQANAEALDAMLKRRDEIIDEQERQ